MSLILSELRRALEKITGSQATAPSSTGEAVRVASYAPSSGVASVNTTSTINSLAAKIAGQLAKLYENPDVTGFENLLQWLESLKARNQYEYSLLVKTVDHIIANQPYSQVWRVLLSTGDPQQAYRYVVRLREKMKKNMIENRLRKYLSPQEIKMVVNDKGEIDPKKLAELIKKRVESILYHKKGMMSEKSIMKGLEEVKRLIHAGVSLAGNREEAWKTIIEKVAGHGAGAGKLQLIVKRVALGDVKAAMKMIASMSHGTATASSAKQSAREIRMAVHGPGKKEEEANEAKNNFRAHMAERIANMAKNMEKPAPPRKPVAWTG